MIFFITFLRALAACLITNSHYEGVYPTEIIANGGMIGDILFFAVSGYCLYNVRYDLSPKGFMKWYGKRIWRIYPPMLIVTAVYMLAGYYSLEDNTALWFYVFPTAYHFVASIMLLYIPFFFIVKPEALKSRIPAVMAMLAAAWLTVYLTVYDRSTYHIDTLREPMIRFLFMESMLLGAWFRRNDSRLRDKFKGAYILGAAISAAAYFAAKLILTKYPEYAPFQLMTQLTVFALLIFLFLIFCGLDGKLEMLPAPLKKCISFISDLTLEIYLVQRYIITLITDMHLTFPINWLTMTACIILAALILHLVCKFIYSAAEKLTAPKTAAEK